MDFSKPYRHHERWRVWYKTLDGERSYRVFDLLEDPLTFISRGVRRTLKAGGHGIGGVLDEYLVLFHSGFDRLAEAG